jgi:hypothetical protein
MDEISRVRSPGLSYLLKSAAGRDATRSSGALSERRAGPPESRGDSDADAYADQAVGGASAAHCTSATPRPPLTPPPE